MSNKHDWDKINREISESIEPKPEPHYCKGDFDECEHGGQLSPYGAWRLSISYYDGAWHPRNWREPAAAMELLKRLHAVKLKRFIGSHDWGCYIPWMRDEERVGEYVGEGTTPEEAIVLAYWSSIK